MVGEVYHDHVIDPRRVIASPPNTPVEGGLAFRPIESRAKEAPVRITAIGVVIVSVITSLAACLRPGASGDDRRRAAAIPSHRLTANPGFASGVAAM